MLPSHLISVLRDCCRLSVYRCLVSVGKIHIFYRIFSSKVSNLLEEKQNIVFYFLFVYLFSALISDTHWPCTLTECCVIDQPHAVQTWAQMQFFSLAVVITSAV